MAEVGIRKTKLEISSEICRLLLQNLMFLIELIAKVCYEIGSYSKTTVDQARNYKKPWTLIALITLRLLQYGRQTLHSSCRLAFVKSPMILNHFE